MDQQHFSGDFLEMFLWSAVAGLLLFYLLKKLLLFHRMPPGPYGFPIIGRLIHLLRVDAIDEFKKYKKRYGDIFSFSCGDHYVIVINGYKNIQEVSKREDLSGRPNFHVWEIRNFGKRNRGILFCDVGPVWQEHRRFALRSLRSFGFGKESMEGMIVHEMEQLVIQLKKNIGIPINLSGSFNASVLNSLWSILSGKRYELDDPKFSEAISLMIANFQAVNLTFPGFFFPWPAKYNLVGRGLWAQGKLLRVKMRALIGEHIDNHMANYQEDVTRDFIDAFIQEMRKSDKDSSFHGEEGEFNLRVVLLDLFIAGVETTSTTLLWSVLFLTQNPNIQKKLQAEIDNVIGNRPAQRDDRPKLVYLEAFLNEVHRMCTLIPMSVYHKALKDTELHGNLIPKGAVLFLNINDAHHDPQVWGDPETFRPERFLDSSGTKIVKHEALMPFGAGTRQCLGEPLAKDTLFIVLSGLLQHFNFEIDSAMANSVNTKGTPTFISSPNAFKVIISERG